MEIFGIPDNFHSLVEVLTCNFGEALFEESSLEDDSTNSLRFFFSPLLGFFFTSSSDVSLDEDSEEDLSRLAPFPVIFKIVNSSLLEDDKLPEPEPLLPWLDGAIPLLLLVLLSRVLDFWELLVSLQGFGLMLP